MGGDRLLALNLADAAAVGTESPAVPPGSAAGGTDQRNRQRQPLFPAAEGVLQRERQLRLDVLSAAGFASRTNLLEAESALARAAGAPGAEEGLEKIAEALEILGAPLAVPGAARGRRSLALPIGTELVVFRALFRIGEHLVSFVDFFELLRRLFLAGLRMEIRMMLARQAAIGLLDLVRRGTLLHAEDGVIVFKLDRHARSA